MKRILLFVASAILSVTALAQLTQPPGGITGNMPPWSGGNGTSGQILTSRGTTLAPTFQAAAAGGTPGGATTNVQFNDAGAFNGQANFSFTKASGALTSVSYSATGAGYTTPGRYLITGGNSPSGTGLYSHTTNALDFSCGASGVQCGGFGTNGVFLTLFGQISGGTKFTATGTGCTVGTTVGGATAGTFTLATGPCTSVLITMGGSAASTNGWVCQAHDRTALTVLIGGESASSTTTATIAIPAGAGTADVISFSCTGY